MLDLLRRIVRADGKAEAPPREVLRHSERRQHVRRLQRAARAGAAAGGGDAGEVERDEDRLAFDVLEAGGEVVRCSLRAVLRPCYVHMRDALRDAPEQTIAQLAGVGVAGVELFVRKLQRLRHADDPGDVLGTGASVLLLAAAELLPLDGGALADIERTGALWTVELVRADAEHVDADTVRVDVEHASGLDGVRVEDGARVLGLDHPRGLLDRLDGADLVVDVHDADERGVIGDRVFEVLQVNEALTVDAEIRDAEALLFEALGLVEDGVVLDGGRDDVLAVALPAGGVRRAAQGEIVALAAAGREDELLGLAAKDLGHRAACAFEAPSRLLGLAVEARWVAPMVAEVGEHRLQDALVERGGGGVVEVDAVGHGSIVAGGEPSPRP